MGTVRYSSSVASSSTSTGGSSSAKKGGKRKAASSKARAVRAFNPHAVDPDDLSAAHALAQDMLDQKMASRDKWQICTQRNLSMIRSECMKVRRELNRLEQTIDTVQMQVEDGLAGYEHRRAEIQQFTEDHTLRVSELAEKVDASEKQALEHKDVTQRQLAKINKRMEAHLERQHAKLESMVDEETLLTQLAGMQERHETDLASAKREVARLVDEKVKAAMEEMTRTMAGIQESVRRKERDERDVDQRTKTNTGQVREEMQMMQRRIAELEHNGDRLRADNTQFKAALDGSRDMFIALEDRFVVATRELERQGHVLRSMPPPIHHHHSPPLPPHAPPPPMPPPVNLGPLEQKLHFVSRDLGMLGEDYTRWKSHADGNLRGLREEMNARIRELEHALFKAVNHDSSKHEYEIRSLGDRCFGLRGDLEIVTRDMQSVREQLQTEIRAIGSSLPRGRSRSRSPPHRRSRWRDAAPPPHRPHRRYSPMAEGVEIELAYFGDRYIDTDRRGRRRSRSRSPSPGAVRNRSRSRTPSPHPPADTNATSTTSEMLYLPLNRPREEMPPRNKRPPGLPDTSTTSRRPAARPSRRPPRSHEVIVIEDGDEEAGEEREGPSNATGGEAVDPPFMAPPDRVLDDEEDRASGSAAADGLSSDQVPAAASESPVPTGAPPVANADDLRAGGMLYLCFGGAPALEPQWTTMFAPLRASDLVDAADMLQFQVRHPTLATYPPFLSQFVVKAMQARLVGQSGQAVDGDSQAIARLEAGQVPQVYAQVMAAVRALWNECLVEQLAEMLKAIPQNADSPPLAIASAPTSSAGESDKQAVYQLHREWTKHQARALTCITRTRLDDSSLSPADWAAIDKCEPAPNVFVFLCLFEIVQVTRQQQCTFHSRFRLSDAGKQVLSKLWERTLNKLPPAFFMECQWLDDQSSRPPKMPILALLHALSSLLLHHSPLVLDLASEKVDKMIAESVRMLTTMVSVDGKKVADLDAGDARVLALDAFHDIEIEIANNQWLGYLEVGAFMDVVHRLAKV